MKKAVSALISAVMMLCLVTTVSFADNLKYDFNGDGYENAMDAIFLLKRCVNGESNLKYDANGDGNVNVNDALVILKHIAGKSASDASVDFEAEVVRLVNIERAKNGLGELSASDSALNKAADIRAKEICTLFSHTRPDGTSCFTVLKECNVSYGAAGENIAYGYRTPEQVVEGWMNSPRHRANILNGNFRKIGVGFVQSGYGWVQLFTS